MENFSLLKSDKIKIDSFDGNHPLIIFPHIDEIYIGCYKTIYTYSVINVKHKLKQIYTVDQIESNDYIINVVKIEATDELCVLTKLGAIYKLMSPDENNDNWELVGNMDEEVDVAAWNLDISALAVISINGYVTLLGRYFDVISNFYVNTTEFGESRNISLGWGKTSTQFLGQGIRQPSKANETQHQLVMYNDLKNSIISWRGDGKFFATSTWCTIDNRRKIRVWTDQGLLHSTCDLNVITEPVLSWKPNGICISTTAIPFENQIFSRNVIFFERNGLTHGGFQITDCDIGSIVKCIHWNTDSTILAILIETPLHNSQKLQMWISSNYHWYLKYETTVDNEKNDKPLLINNIVWYSPLCLVLLFSNGTVQRYQYSSRIDVSNGNVIGIVDGYHLMFTPLSSTVIPLPYALSGCKIDSFPNEIVYINDMFDVDSSSNNKWVLALQRNKNLMTIIEVDTQRKGCIDPRAKKGCKLYSVNIILDMSLNKKITSIISSLYHIVVIDTNKLFAIYNNGKEKYFCMIHLYHVNDDNFNCEIQPVTLVLSFECDFNLKDCQIIKFIIPRKKLLNNSVTYIQFLYVECANNRVYRIDFDFNSNHMKVVISFVCEINSQISDSVILNKCEKDDATKPLFIYTDVNCNLHKDNFRLFQFCSNFLITQEFLFAIIRMEYLYCIPLKLLFESSADYLQKLIADIDKNNMYRIVETGAKILCCSEDDASLLLQIPRGNIEVIYPRQLVISKLKKLLSKKSYSDAVQLARKHRLDFNLIFDHSPSTLIESINTFVSQINSPELLNVILNEISPTDTTTTLYKDFYSDPVQNTVWDSTNKVQICMQKFRIHLESLINQQNGKSYFNTLLLTFMKESTKHGYEQALFYLKASEIVLKDNNLMINSIKFIMQHIQDDNLLFNIALGSYDLDLVMKVSEVINKNPQEYMPLVASLSEQADIHFMKYLIDCYLQQYDKALLNLLKCEDRFEECVSFIVKHKMYKLAINNLSHGSNHHKIISKLYAEYLINEKKDYEDAAVIYHRLAMYEKALECALKFKRFDHFQYKNCVGYLLSIKNDKTCPSQLLTKYQNSLLEKLMVNSLFSDAVEFVDYHLNDSNKAFKMSLDYRVWESVIYLSLKVSQYEMDVVDSMIKLNIQTRSENIITLIQNKIEIFNLHYDQLIECRKNIEELIATISEINIDDIESLDSISISSSKGGKTSTSDNRSLTTTSTTTTTNTKRVTTKNRRKLQKKYFITRPGGSYEHFALMDSLSTIYDDYIRLKDECSKLLPLMLVYSADDLAKNLHSSLAKLRDMLIYKYADIWSTRQYLGPVRKDQHLPEPHKPIYPSNKNDISDSKSKAIDTYIESLTPLVSVPNIQKVKEFHTFTSLLI